MRHLYLILLILPVLLAAPEYSIAARIYANSQDYGSQGACIGCGVSNPASAADGDTVSFSRLNTNTGSIGDYVYQNLYFPGLSPGADDIYIAVEDDNFGLLSVLTLANLQITSFNGAVSNGDTRTSVGITISLFSGSTTKYLIKFTPCCVFDRIQIRMNTGVLGALAKLRVYYAYYGAAPLPVELLYFRASHLKKAVTLEWSTATEINNSHFVIEKSRDGLSFYHYATVKGINDPHTVSNYSVYDDETYAITYYRLKQVDFNGDIHYLPTVTVDIKATETLVTVKQPGGDSRIMVKLGEIKEIRVYDLHGKLIKYSQCNACSRPEIELPGSLKSGMYILSCSDAVNSSQQPFYIH